MTLLNQIKDIELNQLTKNSDKLLISDYEAKDKKKAKELKNKNSIYIDELHT